jgi:hypothetical protein
VPGDGAPCGHPDAEIGSPDHELVVQLGVAASAAPRRRMLDGAPKMHNAASL